MSAAMDIILLQKIDNLGEMGDVVNVKPGFARNYLLPQNMALRATRDNIAYFEARRDALEKANEEKKKAAEKDAKKVEGLTATIIRHAAEGGQLYGSVTARDIAENISEASGQRIRRGQIIINDAFKTIGLFDVTVALHPEVKVDVKVNVARSEDEAEIQAKTGKALIVEEGETAEEAAAMAEQRLEKAEDQIEEAKEEMLEESALEAEKEAAEELAEEAEDVADTVAAEEKPEEEEPKAE